MEVWKKQGGTEETRREVDTEGGRERERQVGWEAERAARC